MTITLHGSWKASDGHPASGTVTIRPYGRSYDSQAGGGLTADGVTLALGSDGAVSGVFNDLTGLPDAARFYMITTNIDGCGITYKVPVTDADRASGSLDLTAHQPTSGGGGSGGAGPVVGPPGPPGPGVAAINSIPPDAFEVELTDGRTLGPFTLPSGPSGAAWLSGSTPPQPGQGADRDFYLNTGNGEVFSKTSGAWQSLIVLKGTPGRDGTGFSLKGSVADSAALPATAADSDAYITADNGHLHIWDGTQWNDAGRLEGPAGPAGSAGPPSRFRPSVPTVADLTGISSPQLGDVAMVEANGRLYAFRGGASWESVALLRGAQGSRGPAGLQGAAGADGHSITVVESSAAPASPQPGDVWIKP